MRRNYLAHNKFILLSTKEIHNASTINIKMQTTARGLYFIITQNVCKQNIEQVFILFFAHFLPF